MTDDAELLRHYVRTNSHEAFADLVARRVDMVYAVALRRVGGNTHAAEEITQLVFTDLARKAKALSRHPIIEGWLFKSTHFASAKWLRTEQRRRQRETEAHAMNVVQPDESPEIDAKNIRPLLDDALMELGDRDREAVLLRFFTGLGFGELGSRLQLSEDGARSRVARALDKLQAALAKRGITSTSAALATTLGTQAAGVAPTGLAAAATHSALTAVVSGSVLTLFMSSITFKTCIVTAVVAAGAAGFYWQHREYSRLQMENDRLRTTVAARVQEENRHTEEIARLTAVLATEVQAIEGDQPYENALARWIGRVRDLTIFLDRYPEFGIPEIALVSAEDWLDATKGITFVVEADYRKALAELRRIARTKSNAAIGSALKQAIAANDGKPPESLQALVHHLSPGLDPSILQRYDFNPSGAIPGLEVSGTDPRFILIEKPVDPLWDSLYFFGQTGGAGIRLAQGGIGSAVEKAFSEFTRVTGSVPFQASQLLPYIDTRANLEPGVLDEYFRALTTKVDL